MKNIFDSKTPEQAFWELRSEILASILTIEGYSRYIQEDIASDKIDIAKIVKEIKAIEVSAHEIHELLDAVADSLRK
jgi:hypothetical protein